MPEPRFDVATDPGDATGNTLVVGLSMPGMAGLSALDYLVRHQEYEHIGHVRTRNFPAIAPFEDGEPRHPIRLYADAESELTVLVCELFVPVTAAAPFSVGVLSWLRETDLSELVVLNGVVQPHGPEGHRVFTTATPKYRERRLQDVGVEPLAGGFLDGLPGEFVLRSLEGSAPPVGVYVTPCHPPGPDLDAALRLLDALESVHGVPLDRTALDESAAVQRQYYEKLADRLRTMTEDDRRVGTREYPEDRMFM